AAVAYALSQLLGVFGLALALSVVTVVIALFTLAAMKKEIGRIDGRRLLLSLARVLAAGAAMYAVAWAGTMLLGTGSSFLERAVVLVVVGGASLAAYTGVAFLLGAEELKSVIALLRRRGGTAED
ncbi:MAG: hypothetical protein LC751_19270, partial [Actinobacteria bacterium]|nr:hypothetical protein [Actinomycetota bacterium]